MLAVGIGGGIYSEGPFNISSSMILENVAEATDSPERYALGGGIATYLGVLTITDSVIGENRAGGQLETITTGGGIISSNTPTLISGSVVIANSADVGGGFFYQDAHADLVNSTVTGNEAFDAGGGIGSTDSWVVVVHSTITDNAAPVGAGIASDAPPYASLTFISASIVTDNRGSGPDLAVRRGTGDGFISRSFNVIGSVGPSVVAFGADTGDVVGQSNIGLLALADNGGPTMTHALVDGSMAVDRVTGPIIVEASIADGVFDVDQRGIARPQGAASDAGAYEGVGLVAALCAGQRVTINLATNGGNGDGTAADDVILGTAAPEHINGLEGDDTICGQGGNDVIRGGPGNDTLNGDEGADRILGGGGNDNIDGGPGGDTLLGQGGTDTISGGTGPDDIDGNGAADTIDGGPGGDTIRGQNGADTIDGGPGGDTIRGQTGPDTLSGHGGPDELFGGAGNDTLSGGPETDTCAGNTGNADTAEAATCESTPGIETLF